MKRRAKTAVGSGDSARLSVGQYACSLDRFTLNMEPSMENI